MHKVVKRIFKHVDNYVRYLRRVQIGSVSLGSLDIGDFRELSKKEVESF